MLLTLGGWDKRGSAVNGAGATLSVCMFCGRNPAPAFALTAHSGEPGEIASWRRVVAPVCARCLAMLRSAGPEGRVVRATGERWFLGHGMGRYAPPGDEA